MWQPPRNQEPRNHLAQYFEPIGMSILMAHKNNTDGGNVEVQRPKVSPRISRLCKLLSGAQRSWSIFSLRTTTMSFLISRLFHLFIYMLATASKNVTRILYSRLTILVFGKSDQSFAESPISRIRRRLANRQVPHSTPGKAATTTTAKYDPSNCCERFLDF